MNTDSEALFLRPVTAGVLLGLSGAAVLPLVLSNLSQAAGLALVFNLVLIVFSLAAIVISLVFCWRTMTYREERERFQTLLDQHLDEE
jgi:NhaP-type Na+/H+ and K+/H+ antiporter